MTRFVLLAVMFVLGASSSFSREMLVTSPVEFAEAINKAVGGDTILLSDGHYSDLSIPSSAHFDRTVTIRSQDKSSPAKISSLIIRGASNISIENVKFDYEYTIGDRIQKRVVDIQNSSYVRISNCIIDGDIVRGTGVPHDDGFASGIGMYVGDSKQIEISENVFRTLHRGAVFHKVIDLVVFKNEVTAMRSDGLNFADVTNATISENHIHDFLVSHKSADHADMIQFWTRGTDNPSSNIRILNNFLDASKDNQTQSIFMGNEAVARQGAGNNMYYRKISVVGNVIRNAHLHGITVGEAQDVKILNNTLIQLFPSATAKSVNIPNINVAVTSREVEIRKNIVPRAQKHLQKKALGWNVADNYIAQRSSPAKPNYYTNIFVDALSSDALTLSDLAVLPDSEIARMDVGSPLLSFNATPANLTGYIQVRSSSASGLRLKFDASALYGSGGPINPDQVTSVSWAFGDGQAGEGLSTDHHFAAPASYVVTALVKLKSGESLTLKRTVEAGMRSLLR